MYVGLKGTRRLTGHHLDDTKLLGLNGRATCLGLVSEKAKPPSPSPAKHAATVQMDTSEGKPRNGNEQWSVIPQLMPCQNPFLQSPDS